MTDVTKFVRATAERAVKTFAQSAAAILVAKGTGLMGTDWLDILDVAGIAAVLSVLTSLGSATVNGDSPSLSGEQLTYEPKHGED